MFSFWSNAVSQKRPKNRDAAEVEPVIEGIEGVVVEQVAVAPPLPLEEKFGAIQSIPDEMLSMVFSHLSPRDLLSWYVLLLLLLSLLS